MIYSIGITSFLGPVKAWDTHAELILIRGIGLTSASGVTRRVPAFKKKPIFAERRLLSLCAVFLGGVLGSNC